MIAEERARKKHRTDQSIKKKTCVGQSAPKCSQPSGTLSPLCAELVWFIGSFCALDAYSSSSYTTLSCCSRRLRSCYAHDLSYWAKKTAALNHRLLNPETLLRVSILDFESSDDSDMSDDNDRGFRNEQEAAAAARQDPHMREQSEAHGMIVNGLANIANGCPDGYLSPLEKCLFHPCSSVLCVTYTRMDGIGFEVREGFWCRFDIRVPAQKRFVAGLELQKLAIRDRQGALDAHDPAIASFRSALSSLLELLVRTIELHKHDECGSFRVACRLFVGNSAALVSAV